MLEHAADYEWRGEGEEAGIVLLAPDAAIAETSFDRALPAASLLPGVLGPVYAAASPDELGIPGAPPDFGLVVVSGTHVAPDFVGALERHLLLVADAPVESVLGGSFEEAPRLVARRLSEVALPGISEVEAREISGSGAVWAAERGLIEAEDLEPFGPGPLEGSADSLDRRALSAGARDWTRPPGRVRVSRVAELLDSEAAETLGLERGFLALAISVGAEDFGRLAIAAHRERILAGTLSGDFGAAEDLPAAPVETEEARDLVAATHAAANYAAARSALVLYAVRRALGEALGLRAAVSVGGIEEEGRRVLHRSGLAAAGAGAVVVAGRTVCHATGAMLGSAPPFGVPEEDGRWPWEEAGVLSRLAVLEAPGERQ